MTDTEKPRTDAKRPSMIAWHVTDGRERNFWTRIGAAWDHGTGDGLTVKLDCLPLDGRIVLRAPKESDPNGDKPA